VRLLHLLLLLLPPLFSLLATARTNTPVPHSPIYPCRASASWLTRAA